MNTYLVLYRVDADAPSPFENPDPAAAEAGKRAWGAWAAEAGDALLDFGAPTMPADAAPGSDGTRVSGYSIVRAESLDALRGLLRSHPHAGLGSFELHAYAAPPAG